MGQCPRNYDRLRNSASQLKCSKIPVFRQQYVDILAQSMDILERAVFDVPKHEFVQRSSACHAKSQRAIPVIGSVLQ